MEEEFVRHRAWITRERFLDLVGAVSLLPGPSSTELAIYLGQIRDGVLGLIFAGMAFILPAAVLVVGLSWVYARFGATPQLAGLLFGAKPAVVVLIAQAIWALGKTALRTVPLALLAAAVILLSAFGVSALILLIAAGVFRMAARAAWPSGMESSAIISTLARSTRSLAPAIPLGLGPMFLYFLKVGAVLFGSGYVLLAWSRAFDHGHVFAGVCLRCRNRQRSASSAPVKGDGRVSRRGQRRGRGADGLPRLAVRARKPGASSCFCDQRHARFSLSRGFRLDHCRSRRGGCSSARFSLGLNPLEKRKLSARG